MVESGFATLGVMAKCWEEAGLKEIDKNESSEALASTQESIKTAFSDLLQLTWLSHIWKMVSSTITLSHLKNPTISVLFCFQYGSIYNFICLAFSFNTDQFTILSV